MPERDEILAVLSTRLSLTELKTVCFLLDVDSENFPKEKESFALELCGHFQRRHRLAELVSKVAQQRPDLGWPVRERAPLNGANPFYGRSDAVVGREMELARAEAKLRAGNHCSLVGPPGAGKTALLDTLLATLPQAKGWPPREVVLLRFRALDTLAALQEAMALHWGSDDPRALRRLARATPPRLIVLDDVGGMDPGEKGLAMRRWIRGFAETHRARLLMTSNERLNILFRHDDPLRDSPFETLDRVPILLAPLDPAACRTLVAQRLAPHGLDVAPYADLFAAPRQPKDLLDDCAARFEALQGGAR